LYSIRIESDLEEKEKKIKLLKNSNVKLAQTFQVLAELGLAHDFGYGPRFVASLNGTMPQWSDY
jgi:hypothetical protein